jgi:ABC-type antimicrobial peptide transport system ATPase subunit
MGMIITLISTSCALRAAWWSCARARWWKGDTKSIFANPKHPYTKALLEANHGPATAAKAPKKDGTRLVTFEIGAGSCQAALAAQGG